MEYVIDAQNKSLINFFSLTGEYIQRFSQFQKI